MIFSEKRESISFQFILINLYLPPCEIVLNCLGLEIGTTWYLRAVVFTDFAYATNLCDGSLEDWTMPRPVKTGFFENPLLSFQEAVWCKLVPGC